MKSWAFPWLRIRPTWTVGELDFRCWPTAPVGGASSNPGWRRGQADKFGVRYTFNCVLWFNIFEHLLAA